MEVLRRVESIVCVMEGVHYASHVEANTWGQKGSGRPSIASPETGPGISRCQTCGQMFKANDLGQSLEHDGRAVSPRIVHEVMRRLAGRARPLAASSRKFVEAYVDEDEPLPAESGAS